MARYQSNSTSAVPQNLTSKVVNEPIQTSLKLEFILAGILCRLCAAKN